MAIKTVFGLVEGDKNKQCKFVGEYPEDVKLWIIQNEFNVAMEGVDGKLYRLGHVSTQGVVGWEGPGGARREVYGTVISEEYLGRYTKEAEEGKIRKTITEYCDSTYEVARGRKTQLRLHPEVNHNTTPCNINFFKLGNAMAFYDAVKEINSKIKANNAKVEAAALRVVEEQAQKQRDEHRKKLIADVIADEYIEAEDMVSLADDYGIKIPLRTRGWILNKMSDVKSNSLRWQPTKRSDRASDKAIPIYKEVRAAVLAAHF